MQCKKSHVFILLILTQLFLGCQCENKNNIMGTARPEGQAASSEEGVSEAFNPFSDGPYEALVAVPEEESDLYADGALGKTVANAVDTVTRKPKWHYRNILLPKQSGKLYWCLAQNCADGIDAKPLLRAAFALWQPYVPFTFMETTNKKAANIVVTFVNTKEYLGADQKKYCWYRSCSGTQILAAWLPAVKSPGLGFDYRGDAFIDDYEYNWKTGAVPVKGKNGYYTAYLKNLMNHLVGHLIGVDHVPNSGAVMQSCYVGGAKLTDADILAVTTLYDFAYQLVYGEEHRYKVTAEACSLFTGRSIGENGEIQRLSWNLPFNRLPSKCKYDYRKFLIDVACMNTVWMRQIQIKVGECWPKDSAIAAKYVPAMYRAILKREPTSAENKIWVPKAIHVNSRRTFVTALVNSQEWSDRYVKEMYKSQLGRMPSAAEWSLHANGITKGTVTPWEIVYRLIGGPEYFNLCSPRNNSGFIYRGFRTLINADAANPWMYANYSNKIDLYKLWLANID
ncbi:MAG: matrixin family metalloprotease [Fibrobacterota bacterium]